MTATAIPGYRYGDPTLPRSPITQAELAQVKAALLFTDDDAAALRRAAEILEPHVEAILDVWYGFVGSHDFLVSSFSTPSGPAAAYLQRVRARFGQWILDTCRAPHDDAWLAWQDEIGQRHADKKNQTDEVAGAPEVVPFRYVNALIYPIFATIRPFLERGGDPPAEVERMHQAWLKAVLLQVTLWSRAYVRPGLY